jgi:hypothetical protein
MLLSLQERWRSRSRREANSELAQKFVKQFFFITQTKFELLVIGVNDLRLKLATALGKDFDKELKFGGGQVDLHGALLGGK